MSFFRRGKTLRLLFLGLFVAAFFPVSQTNAADGATLYFSPSSSNVIAGNTFSVTVRVNTGGNAMNAAEGSIVFDEAKLQVVSLSKTNSIFTLWPTEPKFSNSDGTVEFSGGLPTPGYSGSNGQIITITFRAKSATTIRGYTEVVLVSGAVLANDGDGTNILSSLGKATYYIGAAAAEDQEEFPSSNTDLARPDIRSTTHPDQTKWYANNDAVLNWSLPNGVTRVRLGLGTVPQTLPKVLYSPAVSEKSLPDLDDGIWYFAAEFTTAQGIGPSSVFRINVDTRAPDNFQVTRVDTGDPTNPQPQILFLSSDVPSGIDHYELKIGDSEWLRLDKSVGGQPYSLPLQLPGSRSVTIRAVDGAGNSTSATLDIVVAPIPAPEIKEAPTQATGRARFNVRGVAIAGDKVLLYALPENATDENSAIKIGEGPVNNGQWTIRADGLKSGNYQIFAYAQDSRGARSNRSNMVSLLVKGGFWSYIIEFIKTLFGINGLLTLFIILYVILITILIHYISGRLVPAGKDKKHEETGEYKRLIEQLMRLRADVERELDLLKDIATHRGLYPEEKHLKVKFGKYHTLLKNVLPKANKKKLGR